MLILYIVSAAFLVGGGIIFMSENFRRKASF